MIEGAQDLRKLAYNRQLVSDNRIVLPEQVSRSRATVLEKPIYELLIDDLKTSSWTIDELSREGGIAKKISVSHHDRYADPAFVAEGFIP